MGDKLKLIKNAACWIINVFVCLLFVLTTIKHRSFTLSWFKRQSSDSKKDFYARVWSWWIAEIIVMLLQNTTEFNVLRMCDLTKEIDETLSDQREQSDLTWIADEKLKCAFLVHWRLWFISRKNLIYCWRSSSRAELFSKIYSNLSLFGLLR